MNKILFILMDNLKWGIIYGKLLLVSNKSKVKKKDAFMIYHTMPVYDEDEIIHQEGTENNFSLIFSESCKWSLDAYFYNSITIYLLM